MEFSEMRRVAISIEFNKFKTDWSFYFPIYVVYMRKYYDNEEFELGILTDLQEVPLNTKSGF
jgi:hypothetical protein